MLDTQAGKWLKSSNGDQIVLNTFMPKQVCVKKILLCTLTRKTVVIIENDNEHLATDALERSHILTGQLGFIFCFGFDAQKVADFL